MITYKDTLNHKYYIPYLDEEVVCDMMEAVEQSSEIEEVLSIESIVDIWDQIIISESLKNETMSEMDNFILGYYESIPVNLSRAIIDTIESMNVCVESGEFELILNSPQINLVSGLERIHSNEFYCSQTNNWTNLRKERLHANS